MPASSWANAATSWAVPRSKSWQRTATRTCRGGFFKESIMCRLLTSRSFFRESRSGLTGAATARCLLPQCTIAPDCPQPAPFWSTASPV